MSFTLAYPAMGPILEFMEANKRIHLTFRCPSLDAIDKSTPLRLDFLEFRTNCIQINKMSYQLNHCEQKYEENQSQKEDKSSREALAPGEIQIGGNKFSNFRKFVEFRIGNEFGDERVRRLPENLEIHMALKKLFGFLLGSRQAIKVSKEMVFDLEQEYILRLPENLKICVKTLNTKKTDFEEILPILDPSCLPLETLKLENAQPHNLQNSVFQTARNVEIIRDDVEWEEDESQVEKWHSEFQKLPNKNIFMDFRFYGQERIVDLIKFWMENGKEIGTCWNFRRRYWEKLNREVKRIKNEIGGTYGRGHSLILPLNDDSELMVVGAKLPENQLRVLQLLVQPKVDRSTCTHKIINQIYSYWLFYSFLTILALMCGSIVFCRIMGPNAIPLVVGLFTISFTFLWLSKLEGFF
ncbi:hypothetical protein B9Z55_008020 [Caenorhabditis nigoni]|uniref:Uncharacterized protein n=2 Tax=Caenorhabditis nigoni TaxID=1611254 RepID=A0A2G5VCD7_9PELO|nr:hypothetical protein B9Z55_008020 [Caenorhabditis nigoni]